MFTFLKIRSDEIPQPKRKHSNTARTNTEEKGSMQISSNTNIQTSNSSSPVIRAPPGFFMLPQLFESRQPVNSGFGRPAPYMVILHTEFTSKASNCNESIDGTSTKEAKNKS